MHTSDAPPRRALLNAVAIGCLVFLTRLPFLSLGYGEHGDSRLIATAGRSIAETGTYTISRVPGYPQMEFMAAAFWRGGPLLLNGLTAVASGIAAALFYLLLVRFASRDATLTAFALAFTPAFYVSSVSTIDFPWTLAWVLAATLAVLKPRPVLAGVLLGMAIGSRLTSGAMVLPLALVLFDAAPKGSPVLRVFLFCLAASVTGAAWYVPSYLSYGSSFLAYQPFTTSLEWTFRTFVAEFWGIPAYVVFLATLASILWTRGKSPRTSIPAGALSTRVTLAFGIAVVIYLIAYWRMPIKGAYLITALPFTLVLLGRFAPRTAFQALCIPLLISPFLFSVHPGEDRHPYLSDAARPFTVVGKTVYVDPFRGPVLADRAMRASQLAYAGAVLEETSRMSDSSVVLTGWNWSSYLRASLIADTDTALVRGAFGFDDVRLFRPFRIGKALFVNLADSVTLRGYKARGWDIYYLSQAAYFNRLEYGTDAAHEGGRPLFSSPMQFPPAVRQ